MIRSTFELDFIKTLKKSSKRLYYYSSARETQEKNKITLESMSFWQIVLQSTY